MRADAFCGMRNSVSFTSAGRSARFHTATSSMNPSNVLKSQSCSSMRLGMNVEPV